MEMFEFGQRIKQRREEIGMSQQELATRLGIDQAKVSLLERGARKIDALKELPLLSKALKCSIPWLCQGASSSEDPVEALLDLYLPDVHFDEFEKKRLAKFLERFLQTYADTMEPSQHASNQ